LSEVYIERLAAQNAQYLTQRQTLVAGNVANASTPGYRAKDMPPFPTLFAGAPIAMATTNPLHMTPTPEELGAARVVEIAPGDETLSGNTVSLEREMTNLGDVNRAYTLNANIKRAFHQMLLATLK